jgi:hypothetical protein
MIDLSIVIVNWNTLELLRNCLNSLIKNIRSVSLEIFVTDNGSTDGSPKMVEDEFPNVRLIKNTVNLGFAKANNQAIKQAQGRYILLLNSDTLAHDSSIEGLVAFMEQTPSAGMAGLQLLNEDGSFQNSVANAPTLLTELTNKSLLRALFPNRYPGKEFRPQSPIEVESLIGACLMVRAETIKAIGLLDEDYFFFFEETDWCLRAKNAGWKIMFHPNLFLYHLQGKTAAIVPANARIEYWRSRYTFFKKHYGKTVQISLEVGLMFRLFVDYIFSLIMSLFSRRSRLRFKVYHQIALWHLKGKPENWGLRNAGKAR